jgi:hypothetical protein
MDEAAQRIIDEARATLDRLNAMPPSEPRTRVVEREEDPLARYKREAEEQEARFAAARAQRKAEEAAERDGAARREWQRWIGEQLHEAMKATGIAIAEVVRERFDEVDDALAKRDQKIERLEVELLKAQAEIAKLNARVVQGEVDRDRERRSSLDLSALPSRQIN